MKSTLFTAAAILFFAAANAQVTDSTQVKDSAMASITADTTKKANTYGSYSTRDSIAAKYKLLPMPGALTMEKTFPVLGNYELTSAATADSAATVTPLTITIDSASKGMVWVEGLPQGKVKAFLKKSPATYRIVAQKTENGTAIPEGTLHLDSATNVLHIALGAPYNDADPAAVFAVSADAPVEEVATDVKATTAKTKKAKSAKAKQKVVFYTATKMDATQQMNSTNSTADQMQNQ